MALVPDNVVSDWYSRQSLVFRNFAYLFQNPLWQRPVPQGFSLCPYWWSAVFSLLVFRPLVYLTLGVSGLVKVCGLTKAIRFTDSFASRFIGGCDVPVMPTIAGLCVLTMVSILVLGIGLAVYAYYTAGILSMLFLPVLLTATFLITDNYAREHRYDPNRCKVEVYTRIIAVLCVGLSALLHPAATYTAFISWPAELVASIWFVITYCGGCVWDWVAGAARWSWSILPWVLLYGGILALWGWVALQLGTTSSAPSATTSGTVSAAERKRRLRQLANVADGQSSPSASWWLRLFGRCGDLLDAYLDAPIWNADEVYWTLQGYLSQRRREAEAAEEAARAKRAAQCKAATDGLLTVLKPVIAVLKQLNILRSYLWQLVKARKQGACPYLTFHD